MALRESFTKISNFSISTVCDVIALIDLSSYIKIVSTTNLQTKSVLKTDQIPLPVDFFKISRDTKNIVLSKYGTNSLRIYSFVDKQVKYKEQVLKSPIRLIYEIQKSISDYIYYKNNSIYLILTDEGILILRKIDDREASLKIVGNIRVSGSVTFQLLINNKPASPAPLVSESYLVNEFAWNKQSVREDEIYTRKNLHDKFVDYIAISKGFTVEIVKIVGLSNHPNLLIKTEKYATVDVDCSETVDLIKFLKTNDNDFLLIFRDQLGVIRNVKLFEEDDHLEAIETNRFLKTYTEIDTVLFNHRNTKFLVKEDKNRVYIANSMLTMKKLVIFPSEITALAWIFGTNVFAFVIEEELHFYNYKQQKGAIANIKPKNGINLALFGFEEPVEKVYFTEIQLLESSVKTVVFAISKYQTVIFELTLENDCSTKHKILDRIEENSPGFNFYFNRSVFNLQANKDLLQLVNVNTEEQIYSLLLESELKYSQFLDKTAGKEQLAWITTKYVYL